MSNLFVWLFVVSWTAVDAARVERYRRSRILRELLPDCVDIGLNIEWEGNYGDVNGRKVLNDYLQ